MSYRSILVHIGVGGPVETRIEAAAQLARLHGAQLVGCYAGTVPPQGIARSGIRDQMRRRTEAAALAPQFETKFLNICASHSVPGKFINGGVRKVDALAMASLVSDLCIVTHGDPLAPEEGALFSSLPESLVVVSSCPVLVLPNEGGPIGKNVLVAWKNKREAGRAVRDALPLLKIAERVNLLTVGDADSMLMPEMHAYLGAHGIIAELHRQAGDDRRAGEAILERSQSLGCDTIVMGAYGRYGAREYVFGGATRFLLARATIALLLSH